MDKNLELKFKCISADTIREVKTRKGDGKEFLTIADKNKYACYEAVAQTRAAMEFKKATGLSMAHEVAAFGLKIAAMPSEEYSQFIAEGTDDSLKYFDFAQSLQRSFFDFGVVKAIYDEYIGGDSEDPNEIFNAVDSLMRYSYLTKEEREAFLSWEPSSPALSSGEETGREGDTTNPQSSAENLVSSYVTQ